MEPIQKFPVDFDAVRKGDVFTVEQLEEITGIKRTSPRFRLAVLGFRSQLERECQARGYPVSLAERKGQLLVLTDEQAAEHEAKSVASGFRKASKSYRRLVQVNPEALSHEQLQQHERNVFLFSRMLQAASRVRRRLGAKPYRSSVAGLPNRTGKKQSPEIDDTLEF